MNSYGLTASCFSATLVVFLKHYKTIIRRMEVAEKGGCLSRHCSLASHILHCLLRLRDSSLSYCTCPWQSSP